MNEQEYREKHDLYMKCKVTRAVSKWSAADDRVRKLEGQLALAKQKERDLWSELRQAEDANPEELLLRAEISEEHSRRLKAAKEKLAA